MAQYMLLLYDNPAGWAKLSPQDQQKEMRKYQAYGERLREKKLWVSSHKLADEPGKVLRNGGGKALVSDGPYSETKEWLGGYYLIEAPNYQAAVEAALDCPHWEHGGTIEVREVDAMVSAASTKR
jgi:hypothetical protein